MSDHYIFLFLFVSLSIAQALEEKFAMRLSIVIPVYNELSTVGEIIQQVLDVQIGVLIVNWDDNRESHCKLLLRAWAMDKRRQIETKNILMITHSEAFQQNMASVLQWFDPHPLQNHMCRSLNILLFIVLPHNPYHVPKLLSICQCPPRYRPTHQDLNAETHSVMIIRCFPLVP